MSKTEAGPNATAFINHILAGLPCCGLYPDELGIYTVDHKDHGIGVGFDQNPEQCQDPDDFIIAYEAGVVIGASHSLMVFSEDQPASECATFIACMLAAGNRVEAPECPHCAEERAAAEAAEA